MRFGKYSGIATDGAKTVVGHKSGLVGLVKEKAIQSLFIHCIIHQEALLGKFVKLCKTMKTVVNIVNLMPGFSKVEVSVR